MKYLRILTLAVLLLAAGCRPSASYVRLTGYAQGGPWYVTCSLPAGGDAEAVKKAIDDTLSVIDWSVSGYNKGSLLTHLNDGERLPLDATFIDLFNISRRIWAQTGGAFDPSCAPLFDLWGFGFTEGKMPSQQAIDSALAVVGMDRYAIYEEGGQSYLRRPEGGKLNFNAIAQGYSCDVVAAVLRGYGVENYMVSIGGELVCKGLSARGDLWRVWIDRPEDGNMEEGRDLQAILEVTDCGIVTSGNYRKFYVEDGQKFAHTIDPTTGRPVSHNLLSATVVAKDAATADAYATWMMVVGLDRARAILAGRPDLEALLVYDQNGTMATFQTDHIKTQ